MKKFHVLVQQLINVEVIAEDRDAAAESALAEVLKRPEDLTHSGEILSSGAKVVQVTGEQPDGRFAA